MIGRPCMDVEDSACAVEAIFYEDDLPDKSRDYTADNARFFTDTLPGPARRAGWGRFAGRRHAHGGGPAAAEPMTRSDGTAAAGPEVRGRRELILDMLRTSDTPLSVNTIAEALSIHANTVRFHLDALIDTGRVERLLGDIAGPGRPPTVYRASRSMNRHGPTNYRLLATMLTAHLAAIARDPARTATELGRVWGPSLIDPPAPGVRAKRPAIPTKTEVLTRVVAALDDLGFEPEPHNGGRSTQIRLRHCPFLDLVGEHGDVICSLHLGLMQGAMTQLNGPVTVDRLNPFVQPDLCVAHLASTSSRS